MPFPSPTPELTGYGGPQQPNYGGEIDPDSWYNASTYGPDMPADQLAAYQQSFWIPKIATGGYIPPEYDNQQAMAALGQTDAYAQRQQYLTQIGAQRVATLQERQAEQRAGGPAAQFALLAGTLGGTAGALAGGGAAAGGSYGGAATTFPLASGGAITGSAIPGVTSAATAAGATAAGIAPAVASGGAALNALDKWLPYATTGVNTLLGAKAADEASDAEVAAMDRALAENARQFDLTRSDSMPWITGGTEAINRLRNPAESFTASPGYEWARTEGQRDIGNSFAARGGAASGNALKALSEFNTGLAQQDYGNWWQQQLGLAGMGSNTTANVGAAGSASAGRAGNYFANQGASRASGVMGKYGSVANGLNEGVSNFLYRRRAA